MRPGSDLALTFPGIRAIVQEIFTALLFAQQPDYYLRTSRKHLFVRRQRKRAMTNISEAKACSSLGRIVQRRIDAQSVGPDQYLTHLNSVELLATKGLCASSSRSRLVRRRRASV
jgi:hypothetical protein